jgi:uncharacterized membrane protein
MGLYVWLKLIHVVSVAVFLFAHGVAGGASFLLRAPEPGTAGRLLKYSQRSSMVSNPALILVIVTGVWMGFAGSWWGQGWLWTAIVILVVVMASMFYVAAAYYKARDAAKESGEAVLAALGRTRPLLAAWIGGVGVILLIALMVLKPF